MQAFSSVQPSIADPAASPADLEGSIGRATEAILAHAPEELGMSYEIADARVEDMRADIWKLTRVTFTGAAILLREKAAYRATSFRMAG